MTFRAEAGGVHPAVYFEPVFVILFEEILPGDMLAVFSFAAGARRGLEPKIDVCSRCVA